MYRLYSKAKPSKLAKVANVCVIFVKSNFLLVLSKYKEFMTFIKSLAENLILFGFIIDNAP